MSARELFSLDGRAVIVTGGGSGLGAAMARAVGDAGAGVLVADMDLSSAEAVAAAITGVGGSAVALQVDVTDEGSVAAMVDRAVEIHGRLDVIFCNAGISGYYDRIDEVQVERWNRVLAVNVTGVMLCAKHAARVMIPQGSGKIIPTASIWGLIGSDSVPIPDYAASKGAVINLTRELALELAQSGVTVNAIAPGFFNTNLGRDKNLDPAIKERLREASIQLIPTHRRGSPEEIMGPALFLASSASDALNGHILVVDQGVLAR